VNGTAYNQSAVRIAGLQFVISVYNFRSKRSDIPTVIITCELDMLLKQALMVASVRGLSQQN